MMHLKNSTCYFAAFVCLMALTVGEACAFDLGQVKVGLLNGKQFSGQITSIDQDGNVSGEGCPEGLNIGDILSVKTKRTAKKQSAPIQLVTLNGGLVGVDQPKADGETVRFSSGSGLNEIPLQSVQAIIWSDSRSVQKSIESPSLDNDRILVQTGDGERAIEGILEKIDATHVHVNYQGKSRTIGLEKVNAVVMADLGLPVPKGSLAKISLSDGSRVAGVITELGGDSVQLSLTKTDNIMVSTKSITSISIVSDRLMYLSDADPIVVEEKSIFAIRRDWQRDKSVELNPLTIRHADFETVSTFNKGLGTQAFSNLVFENVRDFDQFSATVGIDSETNGRGDCRMVVMGDGIELWSKRVRAADGPEDISISIENIKEVALVVYPGEQFDLGDHANWADARFLKTK